METISNLILSIDTSILSQIFSEVSLAFYRVAYFLLVLTGSIMSFIRLNDEMATFGKISPKGIFFCGLFLGFGFAAISVLFHSNIFPISTFFVAAGADYYFIFGDSRILDILKKDYL